jgi:enoyl-CoA hydratase/carnithine racemase
MDLIYKKEGRIAYFTLNRPEKHNTMTPKMMQQFQEAMEDFRDDSDVWVGIITGAGNRAFCAGADVKSWLPFVKETKDKPWRMPNTPLKGMDIWKPLIAAVNGYALGGGGELAIACDIRIAADNATFGWPEVGLGIIPRLGGTQRLPKLIPMGKAMEIMLMGKRIDANEAYCLGLVNHVVSNDKLLSTAEEWAEEICKMAPLAVQAVKQCMVRGMSISLEEGLRLENTLGLPLYDSEDYIEGSTAFREKRRPNFKGR